ncbi:hypothetical protein EDB89DRAFT_1964297 [Lactarius sanguifluus]|nr:hypothetical protein EDB89DRAFT_1964297 [Lactarius sanguifluus]
MAQICSHLSSSGFLFSVGNLCINTTLLPWWPSSEEDDADSEHWPELIHTFGGVEKLSLAGQLVTNILRTLQAADQETSPLPAMKYLQLEVPVLGGFVPTISQAALHKFVASRQLSGRPIIVEYTDLNTNIDSHEPEIQPTILTTEPRKRGNNHSTNSMEEQDLNRHLSSHWYRVECEGESHLFRLDSLSPLSS